MFRRALTLIAALATLSLSPIGAFSKEGDSSTTRQDPATAKKAKASSKAKTSKSSTKAKKEKPKKADGDIDLKKLEVLSRSTTRFPPGEERVKNIKRIAQMLDGVTLKPGESLSLNQFVGPRTEEKGFVKAPSIIDLEYVDTVGGGVSQFATTLYNALYDAGFPVAEHKPHSHYISRYPDGVEATLSWPGPDLVFKNDSESPLVIKTSLKKDRITVKLLGHTPGRRVTRKAPVILERKAAPVELVPDATVSPRKQKVERPGSPRKSVQVTRVVENKGKPKRVDEDVVVYLSSKRVIRVHPCKLPKGHEKYTGEACPNAKKKSKGKSAKPKSK